MSEAEGGIAQGPQEFDAVIIGAGSAGLYQLYRLKKLGLNVALIEAGSGVGGVWYWNRYPGARLDSESYTYAYFFSDELINEWSWSEEFAGQPELERYYNYVADKFDLRRHIRFDTRIKSALFYAEENRWHLTADAGPPVSCRFLITALGVLSAPQFPKIPGLDDFQGETYHTGLWPSEPVQTEGKKIAVIGTGSSGVQFISAVAEEAGELVVFQRTPNWCVPINNRKLPPDRVQELKAGHRQLYERLMAAPTAYVHVPRQESALDLSDEERAAVFDQLWAGSGLRFFGANFRDLLTTREANDATCAYVEAKIRERITDPAVADKLVPTDHGFGTKRPPCEQGYFEAFNRANVRLVDTSEEPIQRVLATGLETSESVYPVDMIVLATGFDALTGALDRIDIEGVNGEMLREHWQEGVRTYLGLASHGFPNLFMINGPQSSAGNNPRTTEFQAELITRCIAEMIASGRHRIEVDRAAEDWWGEKVEQAIKGTLLEDSNARFWALGNNVPGKRRAPLQFLAGIKEYRAIVKERWGGGIGDFRLS
jgi:cation diffusion facilitator CzcD-associated flavoprotein CzcO